MYDPIVVDTFIASYSEIAPLAVAAGQQARSLLPLTDVADDDSGTPLRNIRATAAQSSLLAQFAQELQRAGTLDQAINVVNDHVRLLTPVIACAMYRYFIEADLLRCITCSGDQGHLIRGLTIKRGERVTGWAAANHTTIANSQAELDLMEVCSSFNPPLRSTIAVPLTIGDRLFGVLTGYASKDSAFSDSHRYAFERIAFLLSERLTSLESSIVVKFPAAERR
jgi:GAF domain-containing protein